MAMAGLDKITNRGAARAARFGRGIALASCVVSCARTPATPTPETPSVPTSSARGEAAAEAVISLPTSPLGQLARGLVDAVNSGNIDVQREFVRARFSAKAFEEAPADDWQTFLQRMWAQSGGIEVFAATPPRGPNEIRFRVRSKQGHHYARLGIVGSSSTDKIDAFFCTPEAHPATERVDALVRAPVSDEEAVRAITRRVEQRAATDRFSGTVLVIKGRRVLVSLSVGHADKSFAVANRVDTKFNLGSMNKMFTAVAIGQLVQKGKLAFSDTLAKVLPDYPDKDFAGRATVHHLLSHTSGIGGNIFAPEMFEHRSKFKRPNDYLPLFTKEKRAFSPGERFSYANPGFVVLGAMIERLSGEDYYDYMQKHVFAPAGMRDTGSYEIDEAVSNLAVGYQPDDGDPFGLMARRTNVMSLPFKGTPAGGGYSTAPDLQAFAAALRDHKLLDKAMTETVTSPKVDMDRPGMRYGYGFATRLVNGKEVRGHGGGAPGINSQLGIFWDGSYTVAVMGNYDPPAASALTDEIVEFLAAQTAK
jgi:CubicO group peptidase (beta-lactamase class C family)